MDKKNADRFDLVLRHQEKAGVAQGVFGESKRKQGGRGGVTQGGARWGRRVKSLKRQGDGYQNQHGLWKWENCNVVIVLWSIKSTRELNLKQTPWGRGGGKKMFAEERFGSMSMSPRV